MAALRFIALCAALGGCATLEDPYWVKDDRAPARKIEVHRVLALEAYCPPGARACAKHSLASGVCKVYLPLFPKKSLVPFTRDAGYRRIDELEHELCHCLGFDHPGWSRHAVAEPCPVDVRAAEPLIGPPGP